MTRMSNRQVRQMANDGLAHARNFYQAKEIAARYGADQPAFDASHPTAGCWIDRIAWPPSADDQGTLAEAVAEANRYAKSMMNRCPNCDRPQADDHWCARCLEAAPRSGPMLSILYTCGLIVATGERRPNQRGDEELTVWVAAKRRPPGAWRLGRRAHAGRRKRS